MSFWEGFEKRAASLLGAMPGVTSGLRRFSSAGKIRSASPVAGQSIGARSTTPLLPAARPVHPAEAVKAMAKPPVKVKTPKPPKQYGKGVSTTNL